MSFRHGIEYIKINDGRRPIPVARTSVIGIVGTAPDADDSIFGMDNPTLMLGRDAAMIGALGKRGTLPWAIDMIMAQGNAPAIIINRVERDAKPITSVYLSIRDRMTLVEGEVVDRGVDTNIDELEHSDVSFIDSVWMGDETYIKGTDYKRVDNTIVWLSTKRVETVLRRTSTVDPLDYKDTNLGITEVSQVQVIEGENTTVQFVDGVDFEIHAEGIEWLVAGNNPLPHTEYIVTYFFGKRPGETQDYQCKYKYFNYERIATEIVNRTAGTQLDWLSVKDILNVGAISVGAEDYIEGTDYELLNDQIHWIVKNDIAPITKGVYVLDTPVYGTNAGDGTVESITQDVDIEIGDYVLTCTDDSIAGSEVFSVVIGATTLTDATVGVPYSSNHINFTITAGGTADFENGDTITIPITGGVDKLTYADTPTYAVANTGDGTIGSITFGAAVQNGNYVITCNATVTPTAEEFDVVGPDEVSIGTATVGVPFVHADLSFTITAGGINFGIGDEITVPIYVYSPNLLEVTEISQGVTAFTPNVDYQVNIDGEIEWLANAPAVGSIYNCTIKWNHQPNDDVDFTIETIDYKATEIVAIEEVLGSIGNVDGMLTGMHALAGRHGEFGMTPKILIAPGWTHHPGVVQEFTQVAMQNLAIILADGPSTNNADALAFRYEFGSERIMVIDPWVEFLNSEYYVDNAMDDYQPASAAVAGLINRVDTEFGFSQSPSNHQIFGITGTHRKISKNQSINSPANYLNEHQVSTIVQGEGGGYKLWGNRQCSDLVGYFSQFLTSIRIDDVVQESIVKGLEPLQDRKINKAWFEDATANIDGFLRGLAQEGHIFAGDQRLAWVDPDDNSVDDILQGKVVVRLDFAPPTPAEHIKIKRYINYDYYNQIFRNSSAVRI